MKILNTKIISLLLMIAVLVIGQPLVNFSDINKTYAAVPVTSATGFDVFIDSNGDVNVVTNDKKRTSNIYYKTIGFTISRGKFNPSAKKLAAGTATDYFEVYLGDMTVETAQVGSREINSFKLPYAELKAKIGAASGAWLQEIEDAEMYGQTAYIRFDCIMNIYHGTKTDGYRYKNDPTVGPYDDEARDLNPREIQAAEGWSAGANTGLRTHFHRWLPIGSGHPMIPPVKFGDHHVTKLGGGDGFYGDYSGAPVYGGGDANMEGYDVGQGVPTTSTLTGFAEAAPWVGAIDVWARMVSKTYEIMYRYHWEGLEEKTEYGKDSLKTAIAELEKAETDDKDDDTRNKLKDDDHQKSGHDTELEEVYHHFIEVEWADDADKTIKTTSTGMRNPQKPEDDATYDPVAPTAPKWQYGWRWKEKAMKPIFVGDVVVGDEEYEIENSITWKDHTKPEPKPSGEGIYDIEEMKKDAVPKQTTYKLTCIVDRFFWDDMYGGEGDKKIQVYAAFEYIDPWKTLFYDLTSVRLKNDAYEVGSMGFPAIVLSEGESGKSTNCATLSSFDEFIKAHSSSGTIDSSMIATSDYLKWAEKEKEYVFEKQIDKTYKDDVTELEKDISDHTTTQNDYVKWFNKIDKFKQTAAAAGDQGPVDDGIYLGNVVNKGIVKGCDFRDAHWVYGDSSSLGTHSELIGTGKVLTGSQVGVDGDGDKSKLYYLCKHSSACDTNSANGDANGYKDDNARKAKGANYVFEKLGASTTDIAKNANNGGFPTTAEALYSKDMIGPAPGGNTRSWSSPVLNGHLYQEDMEPGAAVSDHYYSKTTGAMGSSAWMHTPDGGQVYIFEPGSYGESVNR